MPTPVWTAVLAGAATALAAAGIVAQQREEQRALERRVAEDLHETRLDDVIPFDVFAELCRAPSAKVRNA